MKMELLITLGRDSVVAYQNEASARIDVLPPGTSIIDQTLGARPDSVWTA
jgi:hypothetical protein